MIKSKKNRPATPIEIDLTGPEGNAHYLIALAMNLSKQLGYPKRRRECIVDEMMLTDYEGLLHTFDREFGMLVTLWR
tara:strand:- start:6839 stop:7069 length:231 start_codon:yes stop_codon:yes gene_type:complete